MGQTNKNAKAFLISDNQAVIATYSPRQAIVPPPSIQILTTAGSLYVSGYECLKALREALNFAMGE